MDTSPSDGSKAANKAVGDGPVRARTATDRISEGTAALPAASGPSDQTGTGEATSDSTTAAGSKGTCGKHFVGLAKGVIGLMLALASFSISLRAQGDASSAQAGKAEKGMSGKDFFGVVTGVIALMLSVFSLWTSAKVERDVAFADATKTEYGLHAELSKLQLAHPLMTHLFAPSPERYDRAITLVQDAASKNPATRSSRLLEEDATANQIFAAYEQTYLLWNHAKTVNDAGRASFLLENLTFFHELLCNRRLLWYWDERNGMRFSFDFAAAARAYFKDEIKSTCSDSPDPVGPFSESGAAR